MRALCAILVVAVATPARAGVVVGEGVPFSAGELERALSARAGNASLALEVQALAPDRIRVVGATGTWDVEVGQARGPTAARLVALNVLGPAEVATARGPWARGVRLTVLAGASRGVGGDDLTSTVMGVEVTSAGRPWLGAALEWRAALETTPPGARRVDARTWLVRGLVGHTIGRVELAGGPLIGGLRVDSRPGTTAWLVGGHAGARARWSIASRWSLVVGVGGDVYRHRVEVRQAGQVVATTPRVALATTLGLRWEPRR